jgi:hypothetical protein
MLVQLVQKRQQQEQEQLVQKHRRQVLEQQLELEQVLALLFYRRR